LGANKLFSVGLSSLGIIIPSRMNYSFVLLFRLALDATQC